MKIVNLEKIDHKLVVTIDFVHEGFGIASFYRSSDCIWTLINSDTSIPGNIMIQTLECLLVDWLPSDLIKYKPDDFKDKCIIEFTKELLESGDGNMEERLKRLVDAALNVRK